MTPRHRFLAITATATVLAVFAAVAGPVQAGLVDDMPAAIASNAQLQIDAKTAPQDSNVTRETTAKGRDLVQNKNTDVGEVYGQVLEAAHGEALSLDRMLVYSCQLHVQLEYFTKTSPWNGPWTPISGTTVSGPLTPATKGVCVPAPLKQVVEFRNTSPHLDKILHAHSWITTTVTTTPRDDYSEPFVMKRT